MARDYCLIAVFGKPSTLQGLHLVVDVLAVLEDVRLSGQHGRTGTVISANVNNRKLSTILEDTVTFLQHTTTGQPGYFMEAVEDGDQVERPVCEDGGLSIPLCVHRAGAPAEPRLDELRSLDKRVDKGLGLVSTRLGESIDEVGDITDPSSMF